MFVTAHVPGSHSRILSKGPPEPHRRMLRRPYTQNPQVSVDNPSTSLGSVSKAPRPNFVNQPPMQPLPLQASPQRSANSLPWASKSMNLGPKV